MSELIFTKSGKNMLSGNAIEFEVAISPYNYATQKETTFLIITISQEIIPNSDVYTEIKSTKVYPDDFGLLGINVSSIVDAYLNYFTPPVDLDCLMALPDGQCRRFSVKFSLFNTTLLLTENTKIITAIKAGTSYQYFNTDTSYPFNGAATLQKLFVISDGNDRVHIEDVFFVYFTVVPNTDRPQIKAKWVVSFLKNGIVSSATGDIPGVLNLTSSVSIACLPGGFNQLKLQSFLPEGAIPIEYSIRIYDSIAVDYFEPVKFKIDQRKFYKTAQLLYRNSLGGLQPLRLLGEIAMSSEFALQNTSRMAPPNYLIDGNIIGEVDQNYNEENEKFNGETGFITKYQVDRLHDFFLSKQRFEIVNGRLIPIILNNKAVKFYTNHDNLYSVTIDWQRAFTNNFYTDASVPSDICPAINQLQWRQTGSNEITIFWSFPFGHKYGQVSLEFPGEATQLFFLKGNSGLTKVAFIRPASAIGVNVNVILRGFIICKQYNDEPSQGPITALPPQLITTKQNPVAVADTYSIGAGFTTAISLTGSTLANDYDPSGLPIEVVAASGATTAGGLYTIDAAGNVTYKPPTSSFSGADTFTYNIRETPNGILVSATVTINVASAAGGGGGNPSNPQTVYAKIVLRNYEPGYTNSGEVWIDFFSNPAGNIPLDVTANPFTANFNKRVVQWNRGTGHTTNTVASGSATGFKILIFSGALYTVTGADAYIQTSFALLAGTGYTVI